MNDTDNGTYSDDNDVENDAQSDSNGGAMMSIFASYYGIEDDVKSRRPPGDLIDSAHFDSNAYVKELLTTLPVEKLVSKDTSMVHEIRALDGDMQMLVYENYNKFISATETIKRMKNNVDAMDGDMEAVRVKMERISKTAHSIDDTMAENRSKVDKLVRVRRLLSRLEFLSELPEKLSEMIQKENYKDAVQLYSKTIRVLTSHSHVLSFKNIKERIEKMMQDLRGRVMDLLDDPSLEAVKLTQHVAVLQLMEAPRDKVVGKLLTAHKRRSLRMTKLYLQQLSLSSTSASASSVPAAADSAASKGATLGAAAAGSTSSAFSLDSSSDVVGSVSYARKFHQFLVVGLIEACKGILELFPDVLGSEGRNEHASSSSSSSRSGSASAGMVAGAVQSAAEAHTQLQSCLAAVMLEYTKCLADSLTIFNRRVVEHTKVCEVHEDIAQKQRANKRNSRTSLEDDGSSGPVTPDVQIANDETYNINVQTARTAQLRSYEFDEEKQAWMLLIRQAILDCQYLDKAADECQVPHLLLATVPSVPRSQASVHSITFATSILAILTMHHEATFDRSLASLVSSVTSSACEMSLVCDMRTDHTPGDFNPFGGRSSTVTRSRESSSSNISTERDPRLVCLYPDPYLARSAVGQRIALLRALMDRAAELVTTCFSDICEDYRPIVEIHGVAMLTGKGKEDEVCYSSLLMVKFIDGVCAAFENTVGASSANFSGRTSHGSHDEEQHMKRGDIYKESHDSRIKVISKAGTEKEEEEKDEEANGADKDDLDEKVRVLNFTALVISGLMRKISPSLTKQMNSEFMTHELDPVRSIDIEGECEYRMECTANVLLACFSESNSNRLANLFSSALYGELGRGEPTTERGSSGLQEFSIRLDSLAVVCCIMFGETPPAPKMSPISFERDFSRRASTQKNGRTARAGLQLDIERLFAQQIRIFDRDSMITPTLDSVVGTALKASFKSAQEHSRLLIFSSATHWRLQAETSLVKQVAGAVLRDSSGCDALADQVLSSLQARQSVGANEDSLGGGDRDEVSMVFKRVSDSMESIGRATVLLPKQ